MAYAKRIIGITGGQILYDRTARKTDKLHYEIYQSDEGELITDAKVNKLTKKYIMTKQKTMRKEHRDRRNKHRYL